MATQTSLSKDDILGAIGNMSVFELAELIEAFKEKFGVTIAAPVAAAPAGAGGAGAGGGGGGAGPGPGGQGGVTGFLQGGRGKKSQGIQKKPGVPKPGPQEGQDPGEG